MHRIRIIHISDLHERAGRENDSWRRRRVLGDAWIENLDAIVADGIRVDIIAMTGDLADWGKAEEYVPVSDFLNLVIGRLGVPKERLYVVPGNHDIQQGVAKGAWRRLRSVMPELSPIERSRWFLGRNAPRGLRDASRDSLLSRGEGFRSWLKDFGLAALLPENSPHGRLGFRALVPGLGTPVHIVGLDSSWMSGDKHDAGKLYLTEDQVARLATDQGVSLQGFRLALIHHPLSDIADGRSAEELLSKHVDLLLRGHLHDEDIASFGRPDQVLRQIAAGCLYEGECANTWRNAFHVIDVTLDSNGRPTCYDVRLRGWSDKGNGFWFDDASLYKSAPGGRLRWNLSAPTVEKPTPRSVVFIGREPELASLEAMLVEGPTSKPLSGAVCAVYGMAGVGKSLLVERFAQQHVTSFPGGTHRISLEGGDGLTALGQMAVLADRLAVQADREGVANALRERLLARKSLLVIENVDTRASAILAGEMAAALVGCNLVCVGRYRELGRNAGWAQIPVEVHSEAHAIEQLNSEAFESRSAEERSARVRLANALGCLPLALSLAAGHLRRGRTPDGFLAHLLEKGLAVEPADAAHPGLTADRARTLVSSSIDLSVEAYRTEIGMDDIAMSDGLFCLAHAPGTFGRSLGIALSGVSESKFEEMIATAQSLSLIQHDFETGRWSFHPLVAELLKHRTQRDRAQERLTRWFLARLPGTNAGDWKEVQDEESTLVSWLPTVSGQDLPHVEQAGSRYGVYIGPYHAWIEFCRRAMDLPLKGDERSNALFTLGTLASARGDTYLAEVSAREKIELDLQRQDEAGVAQARSILADAFSLRGDTIEALRILRDEVLPNSSAVPTRRAVTLTKIADLVEVLGQHSEAQTLRLEALEIFATLGHVHEHAMVAASLAGAYLDADALDDALVALRTAERTFEELGDSSGRSVTISKIAEVLSYRGQFDEAIRLLRKELENLVTKASDGYGLLVGQTNLAILLTRADPTGNFEEAKSLVVRASSGAGPLGLGDADWLRQAQRITSLPEAERIAWAGKMNRAGRGIDGT